MSLNLVEHEPRLKSEIFWSCTEVIWVAGYGGAGKSTFARFIEKFGHSRVGLGSSVRTLYKEVVSNWEGKAPTLLEWVEEQINVIGEAQFAHDMLKHRLSLQPELLQAERVVIPSMRNPEVLNSMKAFFPNARHRIVFIDAPLPIRTKRLERRDSEEYGEYSVVQMAERDAVEDRVGLQELIKSAEVTIKNEGSLEDFEKTIRNFFRMKKGKNEHR
ncbi:MAG TPA: hypothetical protein VMX76_02105 [Nevskiaceae bacterium]|nr:hypothetical protein [Nevskiaceae bacterium]